MASKHRFYIELGNLRKRLQFGEKILYNKNDYIRNKTTGGRIAPILDEPAWEALYDCIAWFDPQTVYEHNCDFGLHLVNLHIDGGYDCYGCTEDGQWVHEGNRHLNLKDHALVKTRKDVADGEIPKYVDVIFVVNPNLDVVELLKPYAKKGVVVLLNEADPNVMDKYSYTVDDEDNGVYYWKSAEDAVFEEVCGEDCDGDCFEEDVDVILEEEEDEEFGTGA